ncbi:hypothetical protein ACFPYJ_32500 [Paenibacillus solisilvae]|uniref:Lipoprotein n=1 Tax=Paenibacillus solisilvae TaxID=2486751 RepID=A0ABW0W7T7_9BACL
MTKRIGTYIIVLFLTSILFVSCSDEQNSEPDIAQTGKSTTPTTQSTSDFDPSLSDENIQGYYGLMWETAVEAQRYSLYFKAFTQRVLYSEDYIWVAGSEQQNDPISVIRKSEDKNNKMLGIKFANPITTKVNQLPKEIIEIWFNINKEKSFMYLKLQNNKWYSYTILDGHADVYRIYADTRGTTANYDLEFRNNHGISRSRSHAQRLQAQGYDCIFQPKNIEMAKLTRNDSL